MDLQSLQKKMDLVQEAKEAFELINEGISILCSEEGKEMRSKIVDRVLSQVQRLAL